MPFIPLKHLNCLDPSHNPPNMMVFTQAGNWVCPTCGHTTFIPGPPIC